MAGLPSPGGDFVQAPEGTHPAVCCAVVDLGTQHEEYQGKATTSRKVMVEWELGGDLMPDGRPFVAMKTYTFSTHEKAALRRDLEAWRGQAFREEDFGENGFQIGAIIGKPCLVMIGRTSGDKAKVTGVAKMPKGIPAPTLAATPRYLWLSPDEYQESHFESLSDFWKAKIKASPEWQALHAPKGTLMKAAAPLSQDLDDEIPF